MSFLIEQAAKMDYSPAPSPTNASASSANPPTGTLVASNSVAHTVKYYVCCPGLNNSEISAAIALFMFKNYSIECWFHNGNVYFAGAKSATNYVPTVIGVKIPLEKWQQLINSPETFRKLLPNEKQKYARFTWLQEHTVTAQWFN